jgi:hypothetical protein
MESDARYIKASRYDLKAQSHNRRVFHRELVARPWRAFACAIGISILGVNAVFNLLDAPRWSRYPWMGWLLGGIALLFACYFLVCAVLGWQTPPASSHETKS